MLMESVENFAVQSRRGHNPDSNSNQPHQMGVMVERIHQELHFSRTLTGPWWTLDQHPVVKSESPHRMRLTMYMHSNRLLAGYFERLHQSHHHQQRCFSTVWVLQSD